MTIQTLKIPVKKPLLNNFCIDISLHFTLHILAISKIGDNEVFFPSEKSPAVEENILNEIKKYGSYLMLKTEIQTQDRDRFKNKGDWVEEAKETFYQLINGKESELHTIVGTELYLISSSSV